MKSETKNCQNCKNNFVIEPDDFLFYEKLKVPPPTFCPECRLVRRLVWRNERVLYKINCGLCKKSIISMYSGDSVFPIYCRDCWYGDGWDPGQYAMEYDMSVPFFSQYKELQSKVPRIAVWQRNAINSDYSNYCGESKNVYLSNSVTQGCEDVYFSKSIDRSRNIVDSLNVVAGENLYQNIESVSNYNCQNTLLSRNCIDSYYLIDCANCSNCVLSSNLRNKKFYIRNKQYTEREYFEEFEKLNLGSRAARAKLEDEFNALSGNAKYKFANIIKSVNSTGNNLSEVKNCKFCFDIYNAEDMKYCYRGWGFKDSMDFDYGTASEMLYEYTTGALNHSNLRFGYSCLSSVRDSDYVDLCMNSDNLFGCISMRNSKFAILNKKYSEQEYKKLREQIIKQMDSVPYIDQKGRVYKYGEFFPVETSPWAYNHTLAQDFFPIDQAKALEIGYLWGEMADKKFSATLTHGEVPDDIKKIEDKILNEVISCEHEGKCAHQCNLAYRLTNFEFNFYKKHNIPIPTKCPNCRFSERFQIIPGLKLYHRACVCSESDHDHQGKCSNEFDTPYAPNRREGVYCESCYNKLVY